MNLRNFLAHAAKLECHAEEVYRKSAAAMEAGGNREAAAFFHEMAGYSHLHYEDAMRRGGFKDLADLPDLEYRWPGGQMPDSLVPLPSQAALDLGAAIGLALAAERRAVAFYEDVANTADDPQIVDLAEEIAEEERVHVLALERFRAWKLK